MVGFCVFTSQSSIAGVLYDNNFDGEAGGYFATSLGGGTNLTVLSAGAFAGDLILTTGLTLSPETGSCSRNVGISIGDNNFIFHPGCSNGLFRIDGTNGFGNTAMGFTPSKGIFHEMTIEIDVDTQAFSIEVVDGSNPGNIYSTNFTDTNYVAGSTLIGLSTGGGTGEARWDYLTISSLSSSPNGVPIPATIGLVGLGLLSMRLLRDS